MRIFDDWKDLFNSFLYKHRTCICMVVFWLLNFQNLAACIAFGTLRPGKQIIRLAAFLTCSSTADCLPDILGVCQYKVDMNYAIVDGVIVNITPVLCLTGA